jgi:ribulose-5-phosphate 4-epimerase/fuculose-1-phosphate aldolase
MRFVGTTLLGCAALLLSATLRAQTSPKSDAPLNHRALIDELAIANHILANEGVLDAYGHVSVRDSQNAEHFYLARHMAAGMVTAKDIIEYDLDSNPIVKSETAGYTERFIHSEIYRARPDVVAVVHTHAPDLVTFSASSVPLLPIYHMAAFLGEGVTKFEIRDAGGVTDMLIRNASLGRALAKTLADKPAALLRGHGAVVVAPSLHVVVGRAYYMNMNARLQREALLLGGQVTYLETEEARKAASQDGYERAWAYWKQRAGK